MIAPLAGPRFLLTSLAVLFSMTAATTATYPPDYLRYHDLWTVLAAVAAVTCALSAAVPGRKRVAVAGAAAVTAAAARSLAILGQVAFDPPPAPQSWSFWLAALTWAAVALLIHAVWDHVVLPWAAVMRDQ